MPSTRNVAGVLGAIAAFLLFYRRQPMGPIPDDQARSSTDRHLGFWISFIVLLVLLFHGAQAAGRRDRRDRGSGLHAVPVRQLARRACSGCRSACSWASPGSRRAGTSSPTRPGSDGPARRSRGYWERAVAIPEEGRPAITYDWYRSFIQLLLDNGAESWMSYVITFGEMAVGIGLLIGILTGFAAFFGAFMNMSFLLAGSASTNPVLFTLADRPDAGLEGRRLLRRRPLAAADARNAVAAGRDRRPRDATAGRRACGLTGAGRDPDRRGASADPARKTSGPPRSPPDRRHAGSRQPGRR